MSYDLYLLPLAPEDDFDAALALFSSLEHDTPIEEQFDARSAVNAVTRLDPRYEAKSFDGDPMAEFLSLPIEAARLCHDSVQLNGTGHGGWPLAQFFFYRSRVVIHCYSGTTADELDQLVSAVCLQTGLAAVDPQFGTVLRPQADGTLA